MRLMMARLGIVAGEVLLVPTCSQVARTPFCSIILMSKCDNTCRLQMPCCGLSQWKLNNIY